MGVPRGRRYRERAFRQDALLYLSCEAAGESCRSSVQMSTIQKPGSELSPVALSPRSPAADSEPKESFRILCSQRVALAPELARLTDVLPETLENWVERLLKAIGLKETARRNRDLRKSFALLRYSKGYAAVVTV